MNVEPLTPEQEQELDDIIAGGETELLQQMAMRGADEIGELPFDGEPVWDAPSNQLNESD